VHIYGKKSVGNVCRQPDFRIRIAGRATSFDSVVQKIKKYTGFATDKLKEIAKSMGMTLTA